LVLYNTQIFNRDEYGDKSIHYESQLEYIAINTETVIMHRRAINFQDLVLDDRKIGVENEERKLIFSIDGKASVPYYKDSRSLQRVLFELNLDMKLIRRQIYSWLDCLGDVGGLNDILTLFFMGIFYVTNPWTMEKYLIKKLYRQ
jgi:hypothetical protein